VAGHKVTTDSGGSSHRDQLGQSDPIFNTHTALRIRGWINGKSQ